MKFPHKLLRHEIESDLTAGLYAICILWLLGLFRLCAGADGIGFWPMTAVILLSWGIAWFQKLLYWGGWAERPHSGAARRVRGALWSLIPTLAVGAAAWWGGWLADCPPWALGGFCAAVLATLLSWWGCIQLICRSQTEEWNTLLTQFHQTSNGAGSARKGGK